MNQYLLKYRDNKSIYRKPHIYIYEKNRYYMKKKYLLKLTFTCEEGKRKNIGRSIHP
jgi:hypothetical protein